MVAVFVVVIALALLAHITVGIPAIVRRSEQFFAGPNGHRRSRRGR